MIAFGCVVGSDSTFETLAGPGIERASEPDSELIVRREQASIFTAYNGILAELRDRAELEAVVLVHDDLEIVDERFCEKVRRWVGAPEVAVVGAVGARGVRSISWWLGTEAIGRFGWRGVSDRRKRSAAPAPPGTATFDWDRAGEDVDSVDGMILILSPWAVRELRFDEEMAPGFHGYDADICFQARAAGKRVIVGDFDVIHHTVAALGEREGWLRAHMGFARKWEGRMPRSTAESMVVSDALSRATVD